MPALRYWDGSTYRLLGAGGLTGPTGPTGPAGTSAAAHQRWYRNAALSMASGAWTVVGFDTQLDSQDPLGAITWDSTNNVFRVNQAGAYLITSTVGGAISINGTGRRALSILKNGVYQAYNGGAAASVLLPGLAVSSAFSAVAGDTFQIQAYQDSGSTANTSNAANTSFFATVSLMTGAQGLPGPTGPAGPAGGGSIIVSVRAYRAAAFTLPTSAAPLIYDTDSAGGNWDTTNAYDTTAGTFTCPVAGKYRVSAGIQFLSGAANDTGVVVIVKNGTQRTWNDAGPASASGIYITAQAIDTLDLAIGDTISFAASASVARTLLNDQRGSFMTIDLLSGTGPQGATGPAGPVGPPAGYMSLVYYQTIPRPTIASSPYTVTHNLGTTFLLVDVWDSVTHQKVNVQVQSFDINRLGIYVAQDMPNPVNVVVMGTALTPTPIAAGDLATKLYVDAKTTTLPAPLTSGSGIQSFTDALGDVWVAKNGVNGGNWARARDALHARWYKSAALNTVVGVVTITFDSVNRDPYGLWVAGNNSFTAPVAGLYLLHGQVAVTASAAGGAYTARIYVNGAYQTVQQQISQSAAGFALPAEIVWPMNAGDYSQFGVTAPAVVPVTAGSFWTWFGIDYLGTG